MMKFLTPKGVATLVTHTVIIAECKRLEKKQMIGEERFEGEKEVAVTKVLVNPSFPDQLVAIERGLSKACKDQLECLLKDNMRVFAWEPSDMTGGDGTWRMCIDFKNLNSACPKDYYPLPNIDCKVESVMGFRYKCFLDAYKGYHQIQMAEEDEEKTTFYTDQGTYCYTKMPFGLKNAGATYQSKDEIFLPADIVETFDNLKKINMKLNPKKCSFGVEEEKFPAYMVTSKGIRANPKKTKALADLQSLRTLKEMQSLNKKLASLNWFLAKSAEISPSFFNTLKNITKENKHEYRWTSEAEEAFQQMKNLILDLPLLTPPWPKETLYAYLAVGTEAVSAVLLTDRKGRQCPVQYVSRTLNEAERNYALMKKLTLSLIHITRRPRRYFEAHLVKVITNQPIKHILNNSETSRKLGKYAVELGAYNINFVPHNDVKGQVLADLMEKLYFQMPKVPLEKDDVESWTLFTDGASSLKGPGAGLVLIGLINVDSKLVASQINGSYKASKESMIKYLAKAKEYISGFKSFSIENIPRNKNQKADVLSKLAFVAFNHLTKEVLVEVLDERSIERQEVHTIIEKEGDNWMTPIIRCLEEGIWPKDKNEARCLRAKIGQYTMESDILFKKGYLVSMLRCVGLLQANYVIWEIHMRSCGMHVGPRAVVRKAIRQGYYWPTKHEDAKKEVQNGAWISLGRYHRQEEVPSSFGLPRIIVTDNRVQLVNDPFKSWCERFEIHQMNTEVAHPQANGLVERANRSLMEGIKTETPFSLTYSSEAVIPAEIGMPTYRTLMIREGYNKEEMRLNLDLLQERREMAAIREARNEASRVEDQGKLGPK
ncbi:reverse transcriptase domain-containing protein [Tanacetum coccineum]